MTEPLKKRIKAPPPPLLKNERHLFDRQLFEMYIQLVVKQEASDLSNLLRKDIEWQLKDEFIEEMHAEMSRLLKRLVEKSSFFGKYRILSLTEEPDQKRNKNKLQINVKESDFHFGWKAMKTDVMSE